MFICENCEKKIIGQESEEVNGGCVCSNCFESYYHECKLCGDYHHEEDMNGKACQWCVDCLDIAETERRDEASRWS